MNKNSARYYKHMFRFVRNFPLDDTIEDIYKVGFPIDDTVNGYFIHWLEQLVTEKEVVETVEEFLSEPMINMLNDVRTLLDEDMKKLAHEFIGKYKYRYEALKDKVVLPGTNLHGDELILRTQTRAEYARDTLVWQELFSKYRL